MLVQHLGVLENVRAASELATGANVLKVKKAPMLVTLMTKSKVDTGSILGRSPHEVGHDAGYIEGQLSFRFLGHLRYFDLVSLLHLGSTTGVNLFDPFLPLILYGFWPILRNPPFWLELGLSP